MFAREGLKAVGVFCDWNPEHLRQQLEDLDEKSKPEDSSFYRCVYGGIKIPIDTFQDFLARIAFEKQLHRPPGVWSD